MKTIVTALGSLLFYASSLKAQSETLYANNKKEFTSEKSEPRIRERDARRNERSVSYQSIQQFMRDFPNAENVSWNVTKNFEEATFTAGNATTTAYYDLSSELVGTTTEKSFSDLPANAQEYIKKHYNGYTIENVLLFDDNEDNDTDMMLYSTEFKDADNYFVALKNDQGLLIVKADIEGVVSYFKKL